MFLLLSAVAIGLIAWIQYRLVPVPANAPQGLGLVAMCIVMVAFGAFALYLAHIDMMVGELTVTTKHAEFLVTRDADPGRFWLGILWRFGAGTGLIGTALVLPFMKPA